MHNGYGAIDALDYLIGGHLCGVYFRASLVNFGYAKCRIADQELNNLSLKTQIYKLSWPMKHKI